jgi:LuxR family maltose regulon positive regulatory protein
MPSFRETSKLTPPPAPPGLVPRPRLHRLLDEAAGGPLTLVAAGPGSGKTVLVSTWTASSKVSTAWISLDPEDDDPQRLWSLAGDSLLAAGIVGETEGFHALPRVDADPSAFLGALLDLIPGPAQHLLVFDDAHHLVNPEVLAKLDAIVRYGFPKLRLLLISRSDPLLPLHRYRLVGQMHELRAADLAMSKVETHALMRAHGVRLSSHELAMLHRRTEGWAAGLRLSAMGMAGTRNPAQFVTQLALDQGSVGEYLIQEVLDRQPEVVRRLLIQTSFLSEVTGPLASAITGIENSGSLLAELSRTNSFVLRLDHNGDLYRCHLLLGEILRHLLRRDYPLKIDELKRRAARWYQEQDELAAAMRFAAEAHDWARVCDVLLHGGFARAFVQRRSLADLAVSELSALDVTLSENQHDQSDLRIAKAAVAVLAGDLEQAAAARACIRVDALDPPALATTRLVEVIAAQHAGCVRALDLAAAALLETDPVPLGPERTVGLRAAVRLAQAGSHFWSDGAPSAAEALALDALADARKSGVAALELEALGLLQLIYVNKGRTAHAKECQDQSRDLTRTYPHLQLMTTHHLARAFSAFMRADVAGADRALGRADRTRFADADPALHAGVLLMRAGLMIASGSTAEAHHLLQNSPELKDPLTRRLARISTLLLADIETRLGRPNAALKALGSDASAAKDPVQAMTAARAAIELGDPDAAERALRPTLIASESLVSLPILVSSLLISARIAQLRDDDAKAVAEIVRAADLASTSIVQPFVEAEELLKGVLSRHEEARAAWPDIAKLQIPTQPSAPPGHGFPQLAQSLTDRETAVLRRLATTMTTSEMADELCVSINTVKTHIAAIYRKLPAAGRRDAVIRARKLELL